jgi:hypothetical protein
VTRTTTTLLQIILLFICITWATGFAFETGRKITGPVKPDIVLMPNCAYWVLDPINPGWLIKRNGVVFESTDVCESIGQ